MFESKHWLRAIPCRAVNKPAGPLSWFASKPLPVGGTLRDIVIPHCLACSSPSHIRSPLCSNQWRINGSPSVLSRQIFQDDIIQHGGCQKTLQFGVLIFQRFKAVGVRNIHTTIFGFELVKRRGAQTMPAAHLSRWHPSFLLFNHPNYLGFAKSALSHSVAPSKG